MLQYTSMSNFMKSRLSNWKDVKGATIKLEQSRTPNIYTELRTIRLYSKALRFSRCGIKVWRRYLELGKNIIA